MSNIISIPRNLMRKGELVIVPSADYEAMCEAHRRLLWEEKDTDEAIRVFEKERAAGTLGKATSFSEILIQTRRKERRK